MVHRRDDEEGDREIEQRSVTYKVMVTLAITMVIGLVGILYTTMDRRVSNAEADIKVKVDKEEHYRDMTEIRSYMQEIRKMLHEHETNSAKRRGE